MKKKEISTVLSQVAEPLVYVLFVVATVGSTLVQRGSWRQEV